MRSEDLDHVAHNIPRHRDVLLNELPKQIFMLLRQVALVKNSYAIVKHKVRSIKNPNAIKEILMLLPLLLLLLLLLYVLTT